MNKFNELFFSPLSKDYCMYFYFMTVILFVILILTLIVSIASIMKKTNKESNALLFGNILTIALVYFQNRLLYSMCVN